MRGGLVKGDGGVDAKVSLALVFVNICMCRICRFATRCVSGMKENQPVLFWLFRLSQAVHQKMTHK